MALAPSPLRLRLDGEALVANWRWVKARGGAAACGAAVKANGYGLGAAEVARRLAAAGCRDFFVATWAEAQEIAEAAGDASVSVLHGVRDEDMETALSSHARPVLNTPDQVRRWRETGRPCDVMIDTGINRLGLSPADIRSGLLDDLAIETLMSHLACGDEDLEMNAHQRRALVELSRAVPYQRLSLSNSAGVCLGPDYAFDLTRPGLALYGGVPRREAEGGIRQVAHVEAQILQRRRVQTDGTVGYNATFTAERPVELAILNIGYADGYLRGFSNSGRAIADGTVLPVVGRVSMDLSAITVDAAPHLAEGDWVELDYDLPTAAAASGLSQYELLTTLGRRHDRAWT